MQVNQQTIINESSLLLNESGGEFLQFVLGGEHYAIQILMVQEIRGYDAVTKILNTPESLKGVVNLRGRIVPILDLRIQFGINDITYDDQTVVIVLNLHNSVAGIVVDSVSDVIEISTSQIKPLPTLATSIHTSYLRGVAAIDQQMIMLVDIEKLIASTTLS